MCMSTDIFAQILTSNPPSFSTSLTQGHDTLQTTWSCNLRLRKDGKPMETNCIPCLSALFFHSAAREWGRGENAARQQVWHGGQEGGTEGQGRAGELMQAAVHQGFL